MRRLTHPGWGKARGVFTAALMITALWAIAAFVIARPFLPGPGIAIATLVRLAATGTLLVHAGASLGRILWALAISFLPAAALGLAAGRSRRIDIIASPVLYIVHPLPKVAFLPVIMLVFGIGEISKIILVGFIIFSQILVSARDSARRVPRQLIDSVRSLGATRCDLALRVVVPATLPDLLTALRVSLGTAIAVLFLAETFATQTGLGYLILDAWSRIDYPEMYAAIIALSTLGLALFVLVDGVERLACPWRPERD